MSDIKLFLALFLYAVLLIVLCFTFQFDGLYGQDSYNYLRQARDFVLLDSQGEFWPPAYAFTGFVLGIILHDCILALQIISVVSVTLSAWLLIKLIQHFYPGKNLAAYCVAVTYMASPFIVRSGVLVMSDAFAVLLCLLTVYYSLASESRFKMFFLLLFATLAFLCRYASIVPLLPFITFAILNNIKQNKIYTILTGAILPSILLYLNFKFWASSSGSTHHAWLQGWQLKKFFLNAFVTPDGSKQYILPNIIYVFKNFFYPGFLLLFLPLIFFVERKDISTTFSRVLASSILLYAFFLAGIPFQNDRFLLLTFPFIVLLLYPAFVRMLNRKPAMRFLPVIALILAIPLTIRAVLPLYERNKLEKDIASQLKPYEGKTLYAFDIDIALRGRDLNFNYQNLWEKRYTQFEKNALVLFNEGKFSNQWENKNPMLNFNDLKKNYALSVEKKLPDGWTLFIIP